MTIYRVTVEQVEHTCPANPDPHVYDTRRTVIDVIDGGPCRNPITVRCGNSTATVACGRVRRADAHCAACRVIVTEHTITTHTTMDVAA